MNIPLSSKEVATLIDMLSLATLVVGWDEETNVPRNKAFFELQEKMFCAIKDSGFTHLVEYDPQMGCHDITAEHLVHSKTTEIYTEFRDEVFWEELVIHLADRDLIKRIGEERFERLDEETRREMLVEEEKNYWREVEKNGVDHLYIVHPQGG